MYHAYYGLAREPFSLDPDLDFLFLSQAHEEAVAHLAYGLEQSEDVILITGDIGTGKTLALHRLLDQLSGTFEPVLINVTSLDFEQLLRFVLRKLPGRDDPPGGVADLLFRFEQTLREARTRGRKILLVIDEAQNLSIETLESVRMLLNLARPGEQALQLVLVGQLGLEKKLELDALRQFRQRIRVAYRFEYLNREETAAYVRHRLEVAGGPPDLFRREALDEIHRLSGGVPRVVNLLAGKALLAGYVEETKRIGKAQVGDDEALVDSVAAAPPERPAAVAPKAPKAAKAAKAAPPAPKAPPRDREETGFARRSGYERHSRGRAGFVAAAVVVVVVTAAFTYGSWSPWLTSIRTGTPGPAGPGPRAVPDTAATRTAAVVPLAGNAAAAVPADSLQRTDEGAAADTVVAAALAPEAAPVPAATPAVVDSVSVHVASFATPDHAETVKTRMIARGIPSFTRRVTLDSGKVWYRVYLGPFADATEAHGVVTDLRDEGIVKYAAFGHVRPRPEGS